MDITFWQTYASCWSAPEAERRRLLSGLASSQVTYRDPNVEVQGYDAFSDYMGAFQRGFPGFHFDIARVDAHHGRSLAHWHLVDGTGARVQNGVSCAAHDDEGRLRDVTGFFPIAPPAAG